ncbi:MAG: radical SAM family heme chaperone HemW [Candidatus Riflebacteria bacterium]
MITGIYDFTGTGLYIHVPFCFSKCAYCGFYSTIPDSEKMSRYLQRLEAEASARLPAAAGNIHTIFVGGGNPLCPGLPGLKRIFEIVKNHVDLSSISEWTFEANPENLSDEIAAFLKELPGIRISLGVQRIADAELELLGRRARMDDVERALEICGRHFSNFGIDLILGVPGCQSIAPALAQLLEKHRIQHVSAYFLSVEPGSLLQQRIENHEFPHPDEADPDELFELRQVLIDAGFEHYEISNYARPGRRCLHNMNYWKPGDYIGLGPSAVSTEAGLRCYNPADLDRWLADESPAFEQLSSVDRRNEYLMLRLRLLADGLNLTSFERRFGAQDDNFHSQVLWHIEQGNLVQENNVIKLTAKGIIFSDNIISDLFI